MKRILAALLLLLGASAQKDPTSRSWNQPVEPFRIAGNVYYVGASDIASYLIATPKGHIVIDGGFEETAPLIRASIEKLGFKVTDVKILLENHAHYDHVGGLAELKRLTGATFYASAGDAPMLAGGGDNAGFTFPPVKPDRILRDGEPITLGATTLVAHLTPGHTPGATTFTTRVREGTRTLDVVFAASITTLPQYKLAGAIVDDYRHSFAALRALPCDVFLSFHGSFFNLTSKARKLREGDRYAFVDPAGFKRYIDSNEAAFEKRLRAQQR